MDTIALLPDSIANQIAAGEVIQRPSSVVKELLENSVDAGASKIQLSIKGAGKQLIQVIDDGIGMSAMDARMAIERHATSKIKEAQDLFSLQTMGFRGEALASVAAISLLTLKTRTLNDQLGTKLEVQDSQVDSKSTEAMSVGTQIEVKNLFFNIPARRKFLKSDTTELKHIVDEFTRVALAFPEIHFEMYNEGKLLHNFEAGATKNRVLSVFGKNWESKLIPISEKTDYLSIQGFVGKPEKATKSKSNQYFIVNNRYIRSGYLHHAVQRAFEGLISTDEHPAYAIYLDIHPENIDVNVHPTKQEVKFDDERLVYSFLHSTIKHALGKYSITPSLDFTIDNRFDKLDAMRTGNTAQSRSHVTNSTIFKDFQNKNAAHKISASSLRDWKDVMDFEIPKRSAESLSEKAEQTLNIEPEGERNAHRAPIHDIKAFQLDRKYIITTLRSELLVIKQHEAHTKVIYEKLLQNKKSSSPSQSLVLPLKLELGVQESTLLENLIEDYLEVGFDIRPFGNMEYVIHAVPFGVTPSRADEIIIDSLRRAEQTQQMDMPELNGPLFALAKSMSISADTKLTAQEIDELISDLFMLPESRYTPDGKKIFEMVQADKLEQFFK